MEAAILNMLQEKRQGCWRWQKRGYKDFIIEVNANAISAGTYEQINERLHPAHVFILKQLHGEWNVVARITPTGSRRVTEANRNKLEGIGAKIHEAYKDVRPQPVNTL